MKEKDKDSQAFRLVSKAQQGDVEAFEEIVLKYHKLVYVYVFRRLGDSELARDATQEVFARAYHSISSLSDSKKFFPWLFRVAYHVCCNFMRQEKKSPQPVELTFDPVSSKGDSLHSLSSVEEDLELKMLRQIILDTIGGLPENYQLPLMLRYLEDMTYEEIAETLEMTKGAVVGILFRGTRYLRLKLRPYLEGKKDET
ncbi:MAG: sigma-70 family RNA polymerase sigma factor [Planctomycetota bacterium]|nr:MAG: sigma-70 family RNA polymerase sigma factor [Planctomycetota bacterium]